ncbi:hypothetical protein SAMN02745121_07241 [Nannocystis exedens]|uniref:Uncharacterized protein n=1 Tax=Nannocystis exedens TaxID=54 RepID=A0A1I2GGY0_9BACT|nr:hypothetical protein [Nannocystis exedens]PCC69983.1 hypothetical protein NAEX_03011 [Nannocystis exedens]SFF15996.1 hypothetical protein SAMN02745121_07241 [Nannocystis exedens]
MTPASTRPPPSRGVDPLDFFHLSIGGPAACLLEQVPWDSRTTRSARPPLEQRPDFFKGARHEIDGRVAAAESWRHSLRSPGGSHPAD